MPYSSDMEVEPCIHDVLWARLDNVRETLGNVGKRWEIAQKSLETLTNIRENWERPCRIAVIWR
jgi:hypothetical protein